MSYALVRTSMSLDGFTLKDLAALSQRWGISKSEVVRRAVRSLKQEADREDQAPSPLQALDWLQQGGGIVAEEAAEFRAEVKAERDARKYWWEP